MSGGRPGGLTALAVMNFIFGGMGLVEIIGIAAMVGVYSAASDETRAQLDQAAAIVKEVGIPALFAILSLLLIASVLEVLSGFGYLKQKRVLGRYLGNGFALIAIAAHTIMTAATWGIEGMGLQLGTLLEILYPILTLALINTTFREDLVH